MHLEHEQTTGTELLLVTNGMTLIIQL